MRQRQMAKIVLEMYPDFRDEVIEDAIEERLLGRQLARRLGRPLTRAERQSFYERLMTLGFDRCFDVVATFRTEVLAAWLADPTAT